MVVRSWNSAGAVPATGIHLSLEALLGEFDPPLAVWVAVSALIGVPLLLFWRAFQPVLMKLALYVALVPLGGIAAGVLILVPAALVAEPLLDINVLDAAEDWVQATPLPWLTYLLIGAAIGLPSGVRSWIKASNEDGCGRVAICDLPFAVEVRNVSCSRCARVGRPRRAGSTRHGDS